MPTYQNQQLKHRTSRSKNLQTIKSINQKLGFSLLSATINPLEANHHPSKHNYQ